MASPYTISRVQDVAANSEENIIEGQTGRTLVAPSRVQIYLNRESVDVTFTILVGSNRALLSGGAAINTTAGDVPVLPDDGVVDTFGMPGDEIIVNANNQNVAAQEARAIIKVTEVDDNALALAQQTLGQVSNVAFA